MAWDMVNDTLSRDCGMNVTLDPLSIRRPRVSAHVAANYTIEQIQMELAKWDPPGGWKERPHPAFVLTKLVKGVAVMAREGGLQVQVTVKPDKTGDGKNVSNSVS
jgi:hypothetical protein